MKHFALALAFAILALAVPASAETSATPAAPAAPAGPAITLEQIMAPATPVEAAPPSCSTVNGYSCPTLGATRTCVDVCGNTLGCTCVNNPPHPQVKFWRCAIPC